MHILIILHLLFFIELLYRLFIKSLKLRKINFSDLRNKLNLLIYRYNLFNSFRKYRSELNNRRFKINRLGIELGNEFDIIYIN